MRKPPFTNYAIVIGLSILFFFVSLSLRWLLKGNVIMGTLSRISSDEWGEEVFNWYLISVTICLILSLLWLHASEYWLAIDWTGKHSQRSWWLIFLFAATLVAPGIGYGLVWPTVLRGGFFAFGFLFSCVLIQFWVGTLLASPNPLSVVGGRMLRKSGL